MTESPTNSPSCTFVVQFWKEWSAAGSCWRGRIEHIPSGRRAAFTSLKELEEFMRVLGVVLEDTRSSMQTE